jgi:hypothetical protein
MSLTDQAIEQADKDYLNSLCLIYMSNLTTGNILEKYTENSKIISLLGPFVGQHKGIWVYVKLFALYEQTNKICSEFNAPGSALRRGLLKYAGDLNRFLGQILDDQLAAERKINKN